MEFQKDNLVDVDFETMQQLVEEESRKTKAITDQSSSNPKNDQDLKTKEKSRDHSKRDRSKDRHDRDRDEKRKKTNRSRDRSRDKHKQDSRSHGKSRTSRSRDHKRRSRSRTRSRDRRRKNDSEKKENIIIEKTIEEARRQALEAQRDDCTVLVYRLNFNSSEKDVFNFFARAGIGRLIDIKIIRDPRTGKSKGVAYVEFESQESVLLAVALSGQPIRGQAVAIQQSQAEKNRSAAAAKYKKQMIKEQQRINSMKTTPGQDVDAPMKIFVGGLTEHLADITESDIRNIFPFGDIDYIDMHKDPITGKSRGYCFIQFRKGSQARAAISAMNEFEYMGKTLKVGPAEEANKNGNEMLLPSAEDDEGNTAVLHNLQSRQTLMQKLNKDNMVMPAYFPGSAMPMPSGMTPNPLMMMQNPGMGIPPLYPGMMPPTMPMPPNGMNIGGINASVPKVAKSSCLLLSNLFDPSKVNLAEEPEFYEDTKLDVQDECSNFGQVEKIWVEENSVGNVWVKFANNDTAAAAAAFEKLNGRNYNEDRVSIILNVVKPNSFNGDYWPKCSIFGIYDGHGGVVCADFLRDHLHQYVIRNPNFPNNPREAILRGFENAERDFINNYALDKSGEVIDRSGSCAIMIFIIDDICYVTNVGDSRAIMSANNGKNIEILSHDHKPGLKEEEKRIVQAGGKVYQTQTPTNSMNLSILQKSFNIDINSINSNQVILGPSRVFPGRLSVSRSFGDIEAKLIKNGGNPNVVIATPEITCFKLTSEMDFIVLGCDGIFDQLSNKDIIDSIWLTTREDIRANNVHSQCSVANDLIIKSCINRKCLDNVTCVIIAFENFERMFDSEILHTYDGNVPNNNKAIDSNRVMTEINFDNIEKYRSYSNRNSNAPVSTKNTRPKLPLLEDMSNRDHLNNLNSNLNLNSNSNAVNEIKFKNYTPLTTKGFKDRLYNLEYMKKNPFYSNHDSDKDKKADEVSKNRQLEKIVESNSNFAKTKQYMIEAEKENPALNGQMNNNSNHNNTMKIPRKGSFKLGNSIKLNFDYKKQAKDNMPITLMHVNRK